MPTPAAPTDSTGARLLFLVYDNAGTNQAALFKGLAHAQLNSTELAHMAVGTHVNGATFGATDAVMMLAGVDPTNIVRKIITDAQGRVALRPPLMYAPAGTNLFAVQRAIANSTLNGEEVAAAQVATHKQADTVGATDPMMVIAGKSATAAAVRPVTLDAAHRLIVNTEGALGGTGHKNVASTGTAVSLRGATPCRKVRVKADPTNGAVVHVGIAGVTNGTSDATDGLRLSAGQDVEIDVADVATLFVNGTAGMGVSYMWWT